MRILLKNGNIVDKKITKGDILIENGLIECLSHTSLDVQAETVIDCSDKFVVPGLIDMHVHLREPGFEYKEDLASGAAAAIAGGITTLCCMANTSPVIDNASLVAWIIKRSNEVAMADILPFACVTKGMKGEELTEMGDLLDAGACGFSDDGLPVGSAEVMRRALEYSGYFNSFISAHEEEHSLFNDGLMHEGAASTMFGLKGIPAAAESVMVARDIELARLTKGHVHICHVSSKDSVELIKKAKEDGLNITAEVTHNHLVYTDGICESYDPNSKINPPIRTELDRRALTEALKSGVIDCVASDHAPHHIDDKFKEYDLAAFGMLGLQFVVPFLVKLIKKGELSWTDFVKTTSENPAKILNLKDRGKLIKGYTADITVIDPDIEYTYDEKINKSKSRNTLYWNKKMKGGALFVLKKGKLFTNF